MSFDRHGQNGGNRQQEMNLVLSKFSPVRRVRSQNSKRLPAAGNRHGHAADDSMLHQQRRSFEPVLGGKIFHHHRFPGGQRETGLRPRIGGDSGDSKRTLRPADTRPQQ